MSLDRPDLADRYEGSLWRRIGRGIAVIGALVALSACEVRGGKIPYDPAGFGPPDRVTDPSIPYDWPLGPLDVIKINVFRVPDLTGEYQVDMNGNVDLPLIGQVSVRDQDAPKFAKNLESLYGSRFLNDPEITVRVQKSNQLNITVEGGVNDPGLHTLTGRTTLTGAIAMARGINTMDSNPKRIAIFRKRDGKTVAAAFDLISIRHGDMADPLVYPGDTIIVDASKIRAIYRDLLQTLPTLAIFNGL